MFQLTVTFSPIIILTGKIDWRTHRTDVSFYQGKLRSFRPTIEATALFCGINLRA